MVKPSSQILITGSSGFVGRYLIKFAPAGCGHIFAQHHTRRPDSYGRSLSLLPINFLDSDWHLPRDLKPKVIIHAAAMAAIDECEVKPEISHHVNFEATRRLVDLADKWNSRFIFLSTDCVFDGEKGNYSEQDAPNPINVYGHSKNQAEQYILNHLENAVILRTALFYGRALNGRPSFTETMLKSLHEGKQIFLFTDQYRSALLVNNLTSAIWELVDSDFTGIMHIGGTQKVNRLEMGQLLCEMFKLDHSLLVPVLSESVKLEARRPLDVSLDIRLSQEVLQTQFVDCNSGFSIAYR